MRRCAGNPKAALKPGIGESGFTFVEIMLALSFGAIVIVGMYQAFNTLHKWWIATGARSDMRQNARAGLETLTRDIEMAGYQTTSYGDVYNKTGLAITLALPNEIEMDQQRVEHANGTIDWATPAYQPKLVYYHLATDMRTGQQNLYRQIRTQPGLRATDEIVAENVSELSLAYLDKNNIPVDCLAETFNGKLYGEYTVNMPRPLVDGDYCRDPVGSCASRVPCDSGLKPDPLKNIRRITVSLTTVPAGATTLATAATAGAATVEVGSTAGFPTSGKIDLFTTSGADVIGQSRVTYTGKDATHFTGCVGVPALAAGTIVARAMPIGGAIKPFTLTASVLPQNLNAADEATPECTPPTAPTGVTVTDTRSCTGKLRVSWNKTDDLDLAGYKIFYGPTGHVTDFITVPVSALTNRDSPAATLNPGCLLITKDADRTTSPNAYAIQVAAYDSSGNDSERSAAVPGATVSPDKPSKPTGMSVAAPAGSSGELVVSWQAPSDGTATVGYRLYRSTTQFASPDTAAITDSLLIASETTLTAETTSYTDTGLLGCTTFYYALASVNCDETLVDTYRFNTTSSASDYADAHNDGSTTPLDTTPPPPPSLAGSQGWQSRVLLTLTNPLEAASADFKRTTIEWKKTAAFAPIPDSDDSVPFTGFKNRGSQVVVFDSEANAAPTLPELIPGAYTFRAVSYDRCNNPSASSPAGDLNLNVSAGMCADDPPGAPPSTSSLFSPSQYSSCQPGTVNISTAYPGPDVLPDLAGFRVQRIKTGDPATDLTALGQPSSLNSWTDAGPLQDGAEYRYSVTATDCRGQESAAYAIPSDTDYIYPGRLQRYPPNFDPAHELDPENFVTTVSDVPAFYTYHNNVKFFLQNTSRAAMRIKKMAVAWSNPNVVLHSVAVGGAAPVSAGGAASTGVFAVNAEVAAVADAFGNPSAAIPVVLRFATPAGVVNSLTDMRNERLSVSLWVWNKSLQDVACPEPESLVIEVPRGPELGCFSQSAPGSRGIGSYGVAGASGTARDTDINVSTGIGVNIYGRKVIDNSRALFPDGVNRGFKPTEFGVYTVSDNAANLSAAPVMPAGGHVNRTLETIGGDRYAICPTCPSLPVAAQLLPHDSLTANKVHWYYALAVDKTGNWDRVPNPDAGNYAYFQTGFDVCAMTVTPEKPAQVTATDVGVSALVAWCPPATYTNGDAIRADDALTYDIEYSNNGGATWQSAPGGANLSGRSYTHGSLVAGTIYRVRAKKSCVTCTTCTGGCCSGYSNPSPGVVVLP